MMITLDPRTYPLEPWWFLRPYTIHGLSHTRRVLVHAVALARANDLAPTEFEALVHAVAWHDIGRTHDGVEPEHGLHSLARMDDLNLGFDLTPDALEPMRFAIEWHSLDDEAALEAAAEQAPRYGVAEAVTPSAVATKETTTTLNSRLRVLWTLKDADGLDRVRIHDLDVSRLRSETARAREPEAWRLYEELR